MKTCIICGDEIIGGAHNRRLCHRSACRAAHTLALRREERARELRERKDLRKFELCGVAE